MICRHCNGIVRGNECDCPKMFARFENEIKDAEVREDMVLTCLDMMTPAEIAQAIREGVTTMDKVEQSYRNSHNTKLLSNWMRKDTRVH